MKGEDQGVLSFSEQDWSEVSRLLAEVGRSIQKAVRRDDATAAPQQVVGFIGGDTIFLLLLLLS